MNKKDIFIKLILSIFIIIIIIFGFDSLQLENRAFATIIAIDEEDNEILFSVLIADIKKISENSDSLEYKKAKKAKSINEAIQKIDTEMPNKLYFGHLKAIVISNEILENDILAGKILKELEYHKEINIKTIILTPKKGEKAEKTLDIEPQEHGMLGIQISRLFSYKKSFDLEDAINQFRAHSSIKRCQVFIPTMPSI